MSEIHFVGKTRYEDLTETGSYPVPCGGKEKIIILAQSREVPKTYAFLPGTTLKKCCLFLFHNLGPCVAPKENSLKKFTEANFSNLVSYLLYTY